MLKLGKIGLAIVLGLMVSLTLFTSGAFAQSVNSSKTGSMAQAAVATNTLQGMRSSSTRQAASQSVSGGCWWQWVRTWRGSFRRLVCNGWNRGRWYRGGWHNGWNRGGWNRGSWHNGWNRGGGWNNGRNRGGWRR